MVSGRVVHGRGRCERAQRRGIIRQVLYGNNWFRKELGKASAEYMLPDCFGFPGVAADDSGALRGERAFRRRNWCGDRLRPAAVRNRSEKTPEGTPFNVGVWVGPDGESVLAG
jgi:alpha-mannosidase